MKIQFTYWKGPDGWHLGYLNQWPDHWTQGKDPEDLKAPLQTSIILFRKKIYQGLGLNGLMKLTLHEEVGVAKNPEK